jgi:hypothetical protein
MELIADGQWHRYAWDLDDDSQWEGWFNGDGVIDTVDFTIDSIQLFGGNANATVFIDDVFHDTTPMAAVDFNNDGSVDGDDLVRWQQSLGASANADADSDGDSDGADFLAWQRQLESGQPLSNVVPVPEPAGWMAGLASAVALIGFRHKGRRRDSA